MGEAYHTCAVQGPAHRPLASCKKKVARGHRRSSYHRCWSHVTARVNLTDRSGQTGTVRYRYTSPVWPEIGRYRSKSNLNSKISIRTGIPAG